MFYTDAMLQNVKYPTHTIISMPALSPTMTMGSLGTWQKNIGDEITPGDVLVEIETDKAQMDFECQEEGYLAKILVESGTKEVNVGKPIAVLAESKDSIEEFADFAVEEAGATPPSPKAEETEEIKPETPSPSTSQPSSSPPPSSERIFASPVARRLAVERNISLDQVTGTGPKNRITKSDVENYIASGGAAKQQQPTTKQPSSRQTKISTATPTVAAYKDIPLSNVRKVIATRLSESKQAIPHYYLTVEVEVDEVLKLRETLNSQSNGRYKLSVNDFIIKAAASALMVVPEVNSAWYNDFIRQYQSADVSVATATPTGLLTPIVRNAQSLGLASISNQVKELAGRAREGKLAPEEYQGGSFTISNLGMYGIKSFTAIINPPQSCILAIGSAEKKLILDSSSSNTGGEYRVVNTLHATLSCDHRVVDGAVGAQWLKEWRSYIENPY
ncbi:15003_t:CDS:2, partial [Entrophospora sp. SA101]